MVPPARGKISPEPGIPHYLAVAGAHVRLSHRADRLADFIGVSQGQPDHAQDPDTHGTGTGEPGVFAAVPCRCITHRGRYHGCGHTSASTGIYRYAAQTAERSGTYPHRRRLSSFNPLSLCGLWRLFLFWRDRPPWNGRFYSHRRIRDWLSLLELEWIHTERLFYLPPVRQGGLIRKLGFLEKLGRYCWSYLGGVHIMVARKRVASLTPLKLAWQYRRNTVVSGFTKPTTRSRE